MVRKAKMVLGLAASVVLTGQAFAGVMSNGNLVIEKTTNTGQTESVQLVEYNVSGATPVLVNTFNVPGISLPTGLDNDRQVKLSTNGKLLSFVGYATAVGQSLNLYTAPATSVPRAVVTVDAFGTVTQTNLNSSLYSGLEISSAATKDGSEFWIAGENNKNSSTDKSGGPRYLNVATGASYNLYTPPDDATATASVRGVGIYNNQLYYASGSSSFGSSKGVSALGTGVTVPTADTRLTRTILNGGVSDSANDFVMFDLDGNGTNDVAYAARKSGIAKFSLNGLTATYKGLIANGGTSGAGELRAITAGLFTDGQGQVEANIFTTDANGKIFKAIDTNVASGSLNGFLPTAYLTADAGYQFGGLDYAPAVPLPGAVWMGLPMLGALGAYRAYRRARKTA